MQEKFFTFSQYMKNDTNIISASAEDYIEMIYRLSQKNGFTRVNELAISLNVQPPSVTKMIKKLSSLNLIKYEKYGVIILEEEGKYIGKLLLKRHNTIEDFLKLLDINDKVLEETEKMEHTISNDVLSGICKLLDFFELNPPLKDELLKHIRNDIKE